MHEAVANTKMDTCQKYLTARDRAGQLWATTFAQLMSRSQETIGNCDAQPLFSLA